MSNVTNASNWEEIDRVKDAKGLLAVITRHRTRLGKFAVGLYQTFQRPGSPTEDKTMWIAYEDLDGARQVLEDAGKLIQQHMQKMRDVSPGVSADNRYGGRYSDADLREMPPAHLKPHGSKNKIR